MTLRERQEQFENNLLSPYASKNTQSKGRQKEEEKCQIRTDFQRDRDRIIHSKGFRRLKGKTQVFVSPEGDHYRTRLTHTLEVSQIARTISRSLILNEDLTEAISLGHDIGHTPFGHFGEKVLNKLRPGGFKHNEQSIRVVDVVEKDGQGLNLTYEVRDGILNHKLSCTPSTLEGKVVQISDKIAYLNHDIDDAIRAGVLKNSDLPAKCVSLLGETKTQRISTMITDIIDNSQGIDEIKMSDDILEVIYILRDFMYKNVYEGIEREDESKKIEYMLIQLYQHYLNNKEILLNEIRYSQINEIQYEIIVCDYIAGMTDNFAMKKFAHLFLPYQWNIRM